MCGTSEKHAPHDIECLNNLGCQEALSLILQWGLGMSTKEKRVEKGYDFGDDT